MQLLQKSLLPTVLSALLIFTASAAASDKPDHLLTIMTSDSGATQTMALVLTSHYVKRGGSAQILLCDQAADLALQEGPTGSEVYKPAPGSAHDLLGRVMKAGVRVEVCAIFLPNREADAEDLRDGIGVARPDAIAEQMADPNTRLFTH